MLSFRMALRSIGANKMRAILTMLGIIIGVMALVVLVSLVNGATSSVTNAVSSLGSSLLTVSIEDDKGFPIRLETLNTWMEEEPNLGLIAPNISDSATGKGSNGSGSVTVYGTTAPYYDIQALQLTMGRWLKTTDVENNSYVCVLNYTAAENLIGYADCIGEAVFLNNVKYTIVGVLEEDDNNLTSMLTGGTMAAYLPFTTLLRLSTTATEDITTFYCSAAQGRTVEDAEVRMESILMKRFEEDEDAFSLSSQNILEETMDSITSVLTILLGGIAAISLVVGGIGIMNIMLVSVTERTREIGLRLAIGALEREVLLQFLIEAVVLAALGGLIGIAIAAVASVGLAQVMQVPFVFNPTVNLLSFVFSAAIGVVFGYFPARRAARLDPIEALRHE